jgi:hypothetical protein
VITPSCVGEYSLVELLDGVTDDNLHGAVEVGTPLGREAW